MDRVPNSGNPQASSLDDVLGSVQNVVVARAAFREYVRQYPKRRITLSWGGREGGGCVSEAASKRWRIGTGGFSPRRAKANLLEYGA
jgi:hypothetical protein